MLDKPTPVLLKRRRREKVGGVVMSQERRQTATSIISPRDELSSYLAEAFKEKGGLARRGLDAPRQKLLAQRFIERFVFFHFRSSHVFLSSGLTLHKTF
jgi:hypothetical protein